MPPDDDIQDDQQTAELLSAFKESNESLYNSLISATGSNDETLSNFIKIYKGDQQEHREKLKKILEKNRKKKSKKRKMRCYFHGTIK